MQAKAISKTVVPYKISEPTERQNATVYAMPAIYLWVRKTGESVGVYRRQHQIDKRRAERLSSSISI